MSDSWEKKESLNMQKGLFNPHFSDSFFVVQRDQLNPLILQMSFSDQKKKSKPALLHDTHDFIMEVSESRFDFRHFKP